MGLIVSLALAAAAGIAYPHLELAWKCGGARSSSEGCVWAHAYWPLTRWVEPLIVGPIAFVFIVASRRLSRRWRGRA